LTEHLLKMKIKTTDKIVQSVLRKMDERSLVGQKKYGSTMQDEIDTGKKDLHDFLTDVQEEIMDALLYIESAKRCLADEVEEVAIKRFVGDPLDRCVCTENIEVNEEK